MEIQSNALGIPVDAKRHVQSAQKDGSNAANSMSSGQQSSTQVSLSDPSRLVQALDNTSDAMDHILYNHLDSDQKAQLQDIYSKLDRAFAQGNDSPESDKKIDGLFEQAHDILGSSLDKLSMSEHKQLDQLNTTLVALETQLAQAEQGELALSRVTFNPKQNIGNGQGHDQGSGQESELSSGLAANTESSAQASKSKQKKNLSVAELNALSAAELNKLPAHQLKKLNTNQLNKLNASQLSLLPSSVLQKLSPNTLAKLPEQLRPK